MLRLHRLGGATAVLLVFLVLGSCFYTWLALGYPPSTARVVVHAVLGGLATAVLLTKVAIANRFHQYANLTLPLGISAGVLLLGIFLLTALPYFLGWL
jgi:Kef-type K+ transport system membrane component KefB